jgi:hypothetical protein
MGPLRSQRAKTAKASWSMLRFRGEEEWKEGSWARVAKRRERVVRRGVGRVVGVREEGQRIVISDGWVGRDWWLGGVVRVLLVGLLVGGSWLALSLRSLVSAMTSECSLLGWQILKLASTVEPPDASAEVSKAIISILIC